MSRRDADLFHEFAGTSHRCAIKACGLGRAARVHRKPKDLPENRLEIAERDIRAIKRGFRALEEARALIFAEIRAIIPLLGASPAQWTKVENAQRQILSKLEQFEKKFAPKTDGSGS